MSGREWKPGDVIVDAGGSWFWIVEVTSNTEAAAKSGRAWTPGSSAVDADGNGWRVDSIEGARPLVVIDPEDREQVERLIERMAQARVWAVVPTDIDSMADYRANQMQTALRSLVTPPKPDEPTGLGAVVEDVSGRRWTRYDTRDPQPWWWNGAPEVAVCRYAYADIDAIRVLSEGVS